MQLFEYLKWDSDFFGFKIAQIPNQEIDEHTFENIISELKSNSFKLIYIKAEPKNESLNNLALKSKSLLVDKKVTFSIKIPKTYNFINSDEISEYKDTFVSLDLLRLAFQCGEYSRFKVDKNFKNQEFERLYKVWIEKSVNKEIAEKIFTFLIEDKVVGMITLSQSENRGNIGLLGVDNFFRGKNIGKKLIEQTKKYFIEQNIFNIDVVTQLDNEIACNFYRKCGFEISKIENIYHLWII